MGRAAAAVLDQPGCGEAVIALLTYIELVSEAPASELRDLVASLGPDAEAYVTTAEMLRAEGEARGRAEALVEMQGLGSPRRDRRNAGPGLRLTSSMRTAPRGSCPHCPARQRTTSADFRRAKSGHLLTTGRMLDEALPTVRGEGSLPVTKFRFRSSFQVLTTLALLLWRQFQTVL